MCWKLRVASLQLVYLVAGLVFVPPRLLEAVPKVQEGGTLALASHALSDFINLETDASGGSCLLQFGAVRAASGLTDARKPPGSRPSGDSFQRQSNWSDVPVSADSSRSAPFRLISQPLLSFDGADSFRASPRDDKFGLLHGRAPAPQLTRVEASDLANSRAGRTSSFGHHAASYSRTYSPAAAATGVRQTQVEREQAHTKAIATVFQGAQHRPPTNTDGHRGNNVFPSLAEDRTLQQAQEVPSQSKSDVKDVIEKPRQGTTLEDRTTKQDENLRLHLQNAQLRRELSHLRNATSGQTLLSTNEKHALTVVGVCAGVMSVGILIFCGYKAIEFSRLKDRDRDGDGRVDLSDFKEFMRSNCCGGLSGKTIMRIMGLLVVTVGTGAVFWHYGVLQPFLSQILVYMYFVFVLFAILCVLLAEAWSDLFKMREEITKVVQQIETTFGDTYEEISQAAGGMSCITGASGGARALAKAKAKSKAAPTAGSAPDLASRGGFGLWS